MENVTQLDRKVLDRARLSRDPRFDGKFFTAVTSTGIYCRPICPAPSPKDANIRYYPTAAAAAEAGFRPCLRCRPEAAPGTPAWLGTSAVVRRALRLIQDGALDDTSVDQFAARVGVGPRHLNRLFIRHVGASPLAVALTRRLHFAKRLLDDTMLSMTEIALASGFGSLRRFNDAFQKTYGKAPSELRKQPRRSAAEMKTKAKTMMAPSILAAPSGRGTRDSSSLGDEVVLKLSFRPPYDWDHIRGFLAKRAIPGVERVDERGYARTISSENGYALVRVSPVPQRCELELTVRGATAASLYQISTVARRMFDLAADPALIVSVLKGDPLLAPLVRQRPGLRMPGIWDPFECAVRAVMGQQVTVAAGRTLCARVVARAGQALEGDGEGLTHLFPTPAQIAAADLSGLGITGARIAALKTLSEAVKNGAVDFTGSAEDVAASLAKLRGIGAWTAQYVAIRALGEPDAFPAADVVLRRMAAEGNAPLTARELEDRAKAWQPWRSYATMHLWCAASEKVST